MLPWYIIVDRDILWRNRFLLLCRQFLRSETKWEKPAGPDRAYSACVGELFGFTVSFPHCQLLALGDLLSLRLTCCFPSEELEVDSAGLHS